MYEQVRTRVTRADVRRAIAQARAALTGSAEDPTGLAREVQLAVGAQALSLIREAFVAKARGGMDEAGDSWPPLSPKTVAYGRRDPALDRRRRYAAKAGRATRPLLTAAQDKRWRSLYARALRGRTDAASKGHAAAYAWMVLKAEGGRTVMGEYGSRQVEVLRNTGVLLNSLSPGLPGNVLEARPGEVVVGTNVPYAAAHHHGTRTLPERRLWPDPMRWPGRWWGLLRQRLREGLVRVIVGLLQ